MLVLASEGNPQPIPDPVSILPYIGLYTVVHLKPDRLLKLGLASAKFPGLSILRNGEWVPAPPGTVPNATDVSRIFDARGIPTTAPYGTPGHIPLSSDHPDYLQKRYWRLPKSTLGGILSAVMMSAVPSPSLADEEFRRVRILYHTLGLMHARSRLSGGFGGSRSGGPSGSELGKTTKNASAATSKPLSTNSSAGSGEPYQIQACVLSLC
jgi:hypothetical protein